MFIDEYENMRDRVVPGEEFGELAAQMATPPGVEEVSSGVLGGTESVNQETLSELEESLAARKAFLEIPDPDPQYGRPLSPRHREVARLLFLGKRQIDIASRLGYTQHRVCRLFAHPRIKEEIKRLQEVTFALTVSDRLKDLGPASMDVIEGVIDGSVEVKPEKRADMAIWVAEKLDGKPQQTVSHESSTLDKFMKAIETMKAAGETIDVSPANQLNPSPDELPPQDGSPEATKRWREYLRTNFPD